MACSPSVERCAGADRRGTWRLFLALALTIALPLVACSPTLDWRDVPLGGDTRLQFPCKPERLERPVPVLERPTPARLWVCDAGGATWSAMAVDLAEPGRSAEVLKELRAKIIANLNAVEGAAGNTVQAVQVPGMTPGLPAWRMRVQGTRPGGRAAVAQVLLAAHGTQAYQLVVLGDDTASGGRDDAVGEFLADLRWTR